MIRPAKFADIKRLTALMEEMHERSIYRDVCPLDIKETKAMLMCAIQRHGAQHPGSTVVYVADRDGAAEGFLIGCLSRLYGIGVKLMAADTHFYVSRRAHPRDAFKLVDAFEGWATANPNVIEINLCATDAVGEYRRTEKLYLRKGFAPFGTVLTKRVNGGADV